MANGQDVPTEPGGTDNGNASARDVAWPLLDSPG
ncbi:MAG: hypothetical protein QOG97_327 [Acidimicrobiaceae bacterium]|nr:hypothetical protein [Acidimicrobiaceae bacterium]